jgi:hypothetical protein
LSARAITNGFPKNTARRLGSSSMGRSWLRSISW